MPDLIAIDWGTSSFRAWALDADGTIVDEIDQKTGILAVPDGDFDGVFVATAGRWLADAPDLPVIASGMITSRNGWCETPYLPLPLRADDLAAALTRLTTKNGRIIHFVTGAARNPDTDLPDVMRGEETELVGHLAAGGADSGVFVLPGTHSKWALADGRRAHRFFDLYDRRGFRRFEGAFHPRTFDGARCAEPMPRPSGAALTVARAAKTSILAQIFSARALALFDRLAPEAIADYLSGLADRRGSYGPGLASQRCG